MATDLTPVLAGMLARCRGPDPDSPPRRKQAFYSVAASLEGPLVTVRLTFPNSPGAPAFCCFEPDCHLGLHDGRRWDTLRRELVLRGIEPPARLRLDLTCTIEAGARSFDLSKPDRRWKGWYAFRAEKKSWSCRVVAREGAKGDSRRDGPPEPCAGR